MSHYQVFNSNKPKMKSRVPLLVLSTLIGLFVSSCTIDRILNPDDNIFLWRIFVDGYLNTEYNYDSEFQLTTRYIYDTVGQVTGHSEYDYNADGQAITIRNYDETGVLYSYVTFEVGSGGLVTKSTLYRLFSGSTDNPQIYSTNLFEYNTSNKPVKVIQHDKLDAIGYYYTCEYTGNNCTKYSYYSSGDSLMGYFEFAYDKKKKPHLPLIDLGFEENNAVKMTSPATDSTGHVILQTPKKLSIWFAPFSADYEYNLSGYPVKVTFSYESGKVLKQELVYKTK
jgi:hypothetical protein